MSTESCKDGSIFCTRFRSSSRSISTPSKLARCTRSNQRINGRIAAVESSQTLYGRAQMAGIERTDYVLKRDYRCSGQPSGINQTETSINYADNECEPASASCSVCNAARQTHCSQRCLAIEERGPRAGLC